MVAVSAALTQAADAALAAVQVVALAETAMLVAISQAGNLIKLLHVLKVDTKADALKADTKVHALKADTKVALNVQVVTVLHVKRVHQTGVQKAANAQIVLNAQAVIVQHVLQASTTLLRKKPLVTNLVKVASVKADSAKMVHAKVVSDRVLKVTVLLVPKAIVQHVQKVNVAKVVSNRAPKVALNHVPKVQADIKKQADLTKAAHVAHVPQLNITAYKKIQKGANRLPFFTLFSGCAHPQIWQFYIFVKYTFKMSIFLAFSALYRY